MFKKIDRAFMRAAAECHMMDKGHALIYACTLDDYGDAVATYTDGDLTICGLENMPGSEYHRPDMTLVTWDAILRLPVDYEIKELDRFKVTHFRGEPVEFIFEVSAPVQVGMTANRVRLKRVEI